MHTPNMTLFLFSYSNNSGTHKFAFQNLNFRCRFVFQDLNCQYIFFSGSRMSIYFTFRIPTYINLVSVISNVGIRFLFSIFPFGIFSFWISIVCYAFAFQNQNISVYLFSRIFTLGIISFLSSQIR